MPDVPALVDQLAEAGVPFALDPDGLSVPLDAAFGALMRLEQEGTR